MWNAPNTHLLLDEVFVIAIFDFYDFHHDSQNPLKWDPGRAWQEKDRGWMVEFLELAGILTITGQFSSF